MIKSRRKAADPFLRLLSSSWRGNGVTLSPDEVRWMMDHHVVRTMAESVAEQHGLCPHCARRLSTCKDRPCIKAQ